MSKRDELRKQYAEFDRRRKEIAGTEPERPTLEDDLIEIVYFPEDDSLKIAAPSAASGTTIYLYGDEAEKLYHFLGGLYG
jgi:hypothetical protein